ncbi:MAG TPA: endonuclease/exonuclease/phosphatase family protein [Acidimicrobiales bacterium]|nr:endonuclease/exonuclease/phosphatase family protein [Acidimicrobiales bacterium]
MAPPTRLRIARSVMSRHFIILAAVAAVAAGLSACSSSTGSSTGSAVTVMTRNMYFGADLSPLFDATASQLGPDATAAYQQLQQSDVPARLQADAQEIVSAKPDLVALQEAVIWSVTPSGQTTSRVAYDFVTGLQADLTRLGSPYAVAASSDGFSGALPVPGVGLVNLQDRDVILVRGHDTRLSVSDPTSGTYQHVLTVHVAGIPINIKRGWAAVDVGASGRRFRVVATHLEAYNDPIRDAQAQELLGLVRSSTEATLVLGDVNSPATGAGSQAYDAVRNAGLGDAWAEANSAAPGLTCCRAADLRSGSLTQRIDMVFTRGAFHVDRSWLVGAAPADRTAGGVWPSDHAGVAATLVPPA